MNQQKKIIIIIFALACVTGSVVLLKKSFLTSKTKPHHIESIWGGATVESPLTQALLKSTAMERIKKIDQSGPLVYFGLAPHYKRYDHCIGVWDLVRRFGGSEEEQMAALLHDASHTVFSHVADHLFHGREKEHSYQDEIHLWFLEKMGIEKILKKHDVHDLSILNPDNPNYRRLEQPSPGLCADRIEYLLHTGILFEKLSQEELNFIYESLRFENGIWFFTNPEAARKIGELSLYFTEHLYGSPWNLVLYEYFCQMLKKALELSLIDYDMIHFGVDEEVFEILQKSECPYIQERMRWCFDIHNSFKLVEDTKNSYDISFVPKFRGVDPLVATDTGLIRITELDPNYRQAYTELKSRLLQGVRVTLNKDTRCCSIKTAT